MMESDVATQEFKYDVGLSFAGEQREYVETVARLLKERRFKIFYDDYERTELWGKDLSVHLSKVYKEMCRYCVMFISQDYASKVWTNHERQNAQARAVGENVEYILPVRFDGTQIDGLPHSISYIDAASTNPSELVEMIAEKIGASVGWNTISTEDSDYPYIKYEFSDGDLKLQNSLRHLGDSISLIIESNFYSNDVMIVHQLAIQHHNSLWDFVIREENIDKHVEEADNLYRYLTRKLINAPDNDAKGELASALGNMIHNMRIRIKGLKTR